MKKRIFLILFIILLMLIGCACNIKNANANELSENINEQLDNIDLSNLEDYLDNLGHVDNDFNISSLIQDLLNGKYNTDYDSIFRYVLNLVAGNINTVLPTFLSIVAISVFFGVINSLKGAFFSDEITEVIFFVCFLSITMLLSSSLYDLYSNTKNIIENIAILCEIMSPIILSLMIASGGTVSASVYKPAVSFLSSGIINIFLNIILPLVGVIIVFNFISNFSQSVKLKKFSDCATSIIKWVTGISFTVFGVFLSIQGITSGTFDGISMKAAKYAISNSVPLIGGFLSSGFDLVVAGSVLIKNAVGIVVIFLLFYSILSPVIYIMTYSLLLKFVGAITEPVSDSRISNLCTNVSKSIGYLLISLLAVGFMLFVTILLMIFSANAFI